MTAEDFKKARELLGLTQPQLGEQLGWSGGKQVYNLEKNIKPITKQTMLAIECLLRRSGKWGEFVSR